MAYPTINVYIDPTYDGSAGQSDGTVTKPYKSLALVPSKLKSAGQTLALKRGTTDTLAAAFSITSGSANERFTICDYGSFLFPEPIITAPSTTALSAASKSHFNLINLDVRSASTTSSHSALDVFSARHFTATGCRWTGYAQAVRIATGTAGTYGFFKFFRCSFVNTSPVSVFGGVWGFLGTAGAIYKNIEFDECNFDNCKGPGVHLKSGDNNTSNAYFDGITLNKCTMRWNTTFGVAIASGDPVGGDITKMARNVKISECKVQGNLGPGIGVTASGGRIWLCEVYGNNFGNVTGTGGLQLGGAIGVMIELNTVYRNGSGNFGGDGAGIYLDQALGNSSFGSTKCVIRRNVIWGHRDFNSHNDLAGNCSSPGIKLFHSGDNDIYDNHIFDNLIGISIDSWSPNNRVYKNTLMNNTKIAVMSGWQGEATNRIWDNIIKGSAVGIAASDAGDKASNGNLTLSATSGLTVTATSSTDDFAMHASGYGIREVGGPGYGFIAKPPSKSNTATVSVLVPFSTTSLAHGTWKKTYGVSQAGINDHNTFDPDVPVKVKLDADNQPLTDGPNDVTSESGFDTMYLAGLVGNLLARDTTQNSEANL